LPDPAAPRGMAGRDRVKRSFRGNSRAHGRAAESPAVPADPNAARFAGVSGARSSDPSNELATRGRAVPMVRASPSRPLVRL